MLRFHFAIVWIGFVVLFGDIDGSSCSRPFMNSLLPTVYCFNLRSEACVLRCFVFCLRERGFVQFGRSGHLGPIIGYASMAFYRGTMLLICQCDLCV